MLINDNDTIFERRDHFKWRNEQSVVAINATGLRQVKGERVFYGVISPIWDAANKSAANKSAANNSAANIQRVLKIGYHCAQSISSLIVGESNQIYINQFEYLQYRFQVQRSKAYEIMQYNSNSDQTQVKVYVSTHPESRFPVKDSNDGVLSQVPFLIPCANISQNCPGFQDLETTDNDLDPCFLYGPLDDTTASSPQPLSSRPVRWASTGDRGPAHFFIVQEDNFHFLSPISGSTCRQSLLSARAGWRRGALRAACNFSSQSRPTSPQAALAGCRPAASLALLIL